MVAPLPSSALRSLRSLVGDAHVVDDPEVLAGHVVDWTGTYIGSSPALVRPGTVEEVAEVVRWARSHRVALVPQGGGTGLVGGGVPLAGEVLLSTSRLVGVEDVDPDAGQLTALAGTTLAAVQAAAIGAGWRYGVDLAARDSATIGGTVATNAGGLRVLRHGTTRRQLLGLEAVLGTGEVVSRLGGLVKDNTGYDLAGLVCGSEGTLGIVTRVRLALVPAPGPTVTALVGLDSVADAVSLVGRLRREVPTLEAAEVVLAAGAELVAARTGAAPVLDPTPPVQLVVEAVGPPDPADALAAALGSSPAVGQVAVATDPARATGLWHVREAHTEAIAGLGSVHKYDVTVPGRALADFVADVPALVRAVAPGADVWIFGHLGDGNLHVNVTGVEAAVGEGDPIADAVLGRVVAAGGSISAEHGIGTAKRAWLARDRSPGDVAAMRAIKDALDPDGILNPNVLLP
ncbi:MAG TPA: FAD-binding oxidoreductase [Acidimicrobiales bacterium]|nr:FAD-binding oxidoreductase [Acidimicrobiales bacterium]